MPRLAANLTFLFTEYPFLERFEAAADAGFDAVEVLFPYEDAVTEVVRRINRAKMPIVLMNTPPPNYTGGDRGFAATPEGEERFRRDFKRTLRYAARLNPRHIHIMAGKAEGPKAHDTYIRNLAWACTEAPNQSLLIEPLSETDMPGYFLTDYEKASVVLAEINADNLGLQFDTYHAQTITGDAVKAFDTYRHLIRHIQVGGFPGRHEPFDGEIDFDRFIQHVIASGYDGFIGAEYNPRGRTAEGLDWMKNIASK